MAITTGVQPAAPRPSPKKPQVSRRSFLRTAWLAVLGAGTVGFGAGTVYFLWPAPSAGFGAKVKIGSKSDVDAKIAANKDYAYFPEGRFYVVPYKGDGANTVYKDVNAASGYLALYQKCVHLGCRVPWCEKSR